MEDFLVESFVYWLSKSPIAYIERKLLGTNKRIGILEKCVKENEHAI